MKTLDQIRAGLPVYPIEVEFPDISRWQKSNTGVDYIHTFESGVAGPHVMVMALTHGNEVSGAIAVDALLRLRPKPLKGRITLGFANVAAYLKFDINDPDASRFIDEDMNRVWSASKLDGMGDSVELRRARELRPIIDSVDYLLDIHSMHEESPPLMMSGPLKKGLHFAAQIGVPAHVIADTGHLNGKRMRDYGGFGEVNSPQNALLIETGQHFSSASKDVALDIACRFLAVTEVMEIMNLAHLLKLAYPVKQRFLHVTEPVIARTMDFSFSKDFRGLEVIETAGTTIATDGDLAIRTPYDDCVIVQPSLRHLGPNVTVMRLAKKIPDNEVSADSPTQTS